MRLLNVESKRLEKFYEDEQGNIPKKYAILSHTWGAEEDELSFEDVQSGNLKKILKVEKCCQQAGKDGWQYVWVDTCCIPQKDPTELGEAINSMFRWYKGAQVCYAYLADVPPGTDCGDPKSKFFASRWFTRGWTLQELLAPETLQFYDSEWNHLGTKDNLSVSIEKITGIPRGVLQGWQRVDQTTVAQRMSWASKRLTKRREDIAYCLLGLFGASIDARYGEGTENAFARLQQAIMAKVRGDDSILAWGFRVQDDAPSNPAKVLSAGALAASPAEFRHCGSIVSKRQQAGPVTSLKIDDWHVDVQLALREDDDGSIFGVLDCGPDDTGDDKVLIPLQLSLNSSESAECIRKMGFGVQLRSPETLALSAPKQIRILKERTMDAGSSINRRHWFYYDRTVEVDLDLIEVRPEERWHERYDWIETPGESEGDVNELSVARFRPKAGGCRDVVVILHFSRQSGEPQAGHHVMTCSEDTKLEDLPQLLSSRSAPFGKHGANNGKLSLTATLDEKDKAGQPMFILKFVPVQSLLEGTVDATRELRQLILMQDLIGKFKLEDSTTREIHNVHVAKSSLTQRLEDSAAEMDRVQAEMNILADRKRALQQARRADQQELEVIRTVDERISKVQTKLKEAKLLKQIELTSLLAKDVDGPWQWIEAMAEVLHRSQMDEDRHGKPSILTGGAHTGRAAAAKKASYKVELPKLPTHPEMSHGAAIPLLLRESERSMPAEWAGRPCLVWAAAHGLKWLVRLHIDNYQARTSSSPPETASNLKVNSAKSVSEKSLGTAAKPSSGDSSKADEAEHDDGSIPDLNITDGGGGTPLFYAATNGLFYAAANGNYEIVLMLLHAGAVVNNWDHLGRTPLSYAAAEGHHAIVAALFDNQTKIKSFKDHRGRYPLSYAAEAGHQAVVKLLLDQGADTSTPDHEGYTPLQLAVKEGHEKVIEEFSIHGQKPHKQEIAVAKSSPDEKAPHGSQSIIVPQKPRASGRHTIWHNPKYNSLGAKRGRSVPAIDDGLSDVGTAMKHHKAPANVTLPRGFQHDHVAYTDGESAHETIGETQRDIGQVNTRNIMSQEVRVSLRPIEKYRRDTKEGKGEFRSSKFGRLLGDIWDNI